MARWLERVLRRLAEWHFATGCSARAWARRRPSEATSCSFYRGRRTREGADSWLTAAVPTVLGRRERPESQPKCGSAQSTASARLLRAGASSDRRAGVFLVRAAVSALDPISRWRPVRPRALGSEGLESSQPQVPSAPASPPRTTPAAFDPASRALATCGKPPSSGLGKGSRTLWEAHQTVAGRTKRHRRSQFQTPPPLVGGEGRASAHRGA